MITSALAIKYEILIKKHMWLMRHESRGRRGWRCGRRGARGLSRPSRRVLVCVGAWLRYRRLGGRWDLAWCPRGPGRLRAGPPVVEGHLDVLLRAPLVLQRQQGHAGPVRLGQRRLDDGPRLEPAGQHHVDLGTVHGELNRELDPS